MKKISASCEALGLESKWLLQTLEQLPFEVSEGQCLSLLFYVQLLKNWNKHVNLTAINDSNEIWVKHILDSLSVLPYLHQHHHENLQYIDVGTGAGLPGIPLAVMQPDWHWRLIDSNTKKINFLHQVRLMLTLKSVNIEHQRTENLSRNSDKVVVLCRAYGPPERIAEQVDSWIHNDEQIYLLQGKESTSLIPPDGYRTDLYKKLIVPQLDASRHLWVLRKLSGHL